MVDVRDGADDDGFANRLRLRFGRSGEVSATAARVCRLAIARSAVQVAHVHRTIAFWSSAYVARVSR